MTRPTAALCVGALLLLSRGEAWAQDVRVLLDTALYHDDDHVNVVSPQAAAAAALDEQGGEVGATAVVDVITAASVDVISQATPGFTEVREEGVLSLSKRFGAWLPGLRYRASYEPDYVSHGGALSFERRLGGADTVLSGSLDLTRDTVGVHGTSFSDWSRTLWTVGGAAGVTQVLGVSTVVRAVYTLSVVDGYQAKPYRYVPLFDEAGLDAARADGTTLSLATFDRYRLPERPPENVPDRRVRHAIGARGLRYLPRLDGALRLDYRLYFDDWGMQAHTVEGGLRLPLGWDLLGEVASRTYYQTSVSFWRRQYVVSGSGQIPEWRTVDKDLSRSLAETITARLERPFAAWAFHADLTATYARWFDYLFLDSRRAVVLLLGARYER